MEPGRDHLLQSWKEIAAFLGVSVKTAQLWESRRGLPVHRLPGPRGLVIARAEELDAWRTLSKAPVARRRRWPWLLVPVVSVSVIVILFAILRDSRLPAGFRVTGSQLIVTDDANRELWQKSFPSLSDEAYRDTRELFWTGDLYGGGDHSVLVVAHMKNGGPSDSLVCYTRSGRERWRFSPGRTVNTKDETFYAPYRIAKFAVLPDRHIVVSGEHHLYFPTQIALLTPDGRLKREYWHSGHLGFVHVRSIKGVTRVVLGGMNNMSRAGTIVVLDPNTMSGASREADPQYQLLNFPPGRELRRITFPRSELNQAFDPYLPLGGLWETRDELVAALHHRPNGAGVYYHFTANLELRTVTIGGSFEQAYKDAWAHGLLRHRFDQSTINSLNRIDEAAIASP